MHMEQLSARPQAAKRIFVDIPAQPLTQTMQMRQAPTLRLSSFVQNMVSTVSSAGAHAYVLRMLCMGYIPCQCARTNALICI